MAKVGLAKVGFYRWERSRDSILHQPQSQEMTMCVCQTKDPRSTVARPMSSTAPEPGAFELDATWTNSSPEKNGKGKDGSPKKRWWLEGHPQLTEFGQTEFGEFFFRVAAQGGGPPEVGAPEGWGAPKGGQHFAFYLPPICCALHHNQIL